MDQMISTNSSLCHVFKFCVLGKGLLLQNFICGKSRFGQWVLCSQEAYDLLIRKKFRQEIPQERYISLKINTQIYGTNVCVSLIYHCISRISNNTYHTVLGLQILLNTWIVELFHTKYTLVSRIEVSKLNRVTLRMLNTVWCYVYSILAMIKLWKWRTD